MSVSRREPEWRLHIGAHKTATTHLQDTLLACRADLARAGVHYVSRDRMLRIGLVRYLRHGQLVRHRLAERFSWMADSDCMRRRLMRRSEGKSIVLISEERLIGRAVDLVDGFYPDLENKLRSFTTLIGREDVTICLSIRNQSEILPSAYAQALRTHTRPGPFEEHLAEWLRSPPRWTDLVDRVRAAFPRATLRVWTFDDYLAAPAEVIAALSGATGLTVPALKRPERTMRLNATALAALEQMQPLMLGDGEKRAATARAALLEGAPFDPLNEEQKALLTKVYERDLAEIAACDWLLPR